MQQLTFSLLLLTLLLLLHPSHGFFGRSLQNTRLKNMTDPSGIDKCPGSRLLSQPEICIGSDCICGNGKPSCCTPLEQRNIQSTIDNLISYDGARSCHDLALSVMCASCAPSVYLYYSNETMGLRACMGVCQRVFEKCGNVMSRDGVTPVIPARTQVEYCSDAARFTNETNCWSGSGMNHGGVGGVVVVVIVFILSVLY